MTRAQTTTYTIDYIAAHTALSAKNPQCNIFEALTTVGGVTNQSWAGGVGYTTGKGIYLHTTTGASQTTPAGTCFFALF